MTFNGKFHVTREVLVEMKNMREVLHDNLCKVRREAASTVTNLCKLQFYGLCIEEPNTCIVSELCFRGSLRDMLENESVQIDWLFRLVRVSRYKVCMAFD